MRRGGKVALLDIVGEAKAAADLGLVYGTDRLLGVACNVTDDKNLRGALERVLSHFGSLTVVINNAGIATSMFEDMTRAVAVNLTAVMRGTEIASEIEGMRLVVNIASVAGLGPVGVTPVYAATKAGVVNFTRSLRWLHRQRGIRVVAVCPSWAATPMVQAGIESGVLQSVIDASPFGIMQPAQVGEALAMALDDTSLAGDIIVVTGDRGVRVMHFRNEETSSPTGSSSKSTARAQPKL